MGTIQNPQILADIEQTAKAMREAGVTIDINHLLPWVAIDLPNGDSYFFQESEAVELLDGVPDNVNEGDYILWSCSSW